MTSAKEKLFPPRFNSLDLTLLSVVVCLGVVQAAAQTAQLLIDEIQTLEQLEYAHEARYLRMPERKAIHVVYLPPPFVAHAFGRRSRQTARSSIQKATGATMSGESRTSRMPPSPGRIWDESLMPAPRLNKLTVRSPA